MPDLHAVWLIFPLVFLGGFIDSIAGGGGIITIPAYLFTGMPAHFAMGCNKLSASVGTTVSTVRFFRHGAMDLKVALLAVAGSFAGSTIASRAVLLLDDKVIKTMVLVILPFVAAVVLLKREPKPVTQSLNAAAQQANPAVLQRESVRGKENASRGMTNASRGMTNAGPGLENASHGMARTIALAILIGLLIGAYDGLLGPGTGTFAIIAFTALMGFDLKTASGNAKALNLASNYAALLTFIQAGTIYYEIALPAALCGLAGNFLGSGLAIRKGAAFIRPFLVVVLILIFISLAIEVF